MVFSGAHETGAASRSATAVSGACARDARGPGCLQRNTAHSRPAGRYPPARSPRFDARKLPSGALVLVPSAAGAGRPPSDARILPPQPPAGPQGFGPVRGRAFDAKGVRPRFGARGAADRHERAAGARRGTSAGDQERDGERHADDHVEQPLVADAVLTPGGPARPPGACSSCLPGVAACRSPGPPSASSRCCRSRPMGRSAGCSGYPSNGR